MKAGVVRLLLVVSLLTNIFLVGLIVGGAMIWSHPQLARRAQNGGRPIRRAGEDLAEPARTQFRAMINEAITSVRPLQRQARDSRRAAANLFAQPRFDAVAVSAALSQARQADLAIRTQLETSVVQFAASLPQEERIKLGAGLAKGGPLRQPRPAPSSGP